MRISGYETGQAVAMPILNRDGVELYYELHGSGPPLLLVAGLASDCLSWQPVAAGLAAQCTVILLDNRGVGRSTQTCETGISLMADDCVALLQHLGVLKASILGHSMGGMVALEVAMRYPEQVDRLILVASAARNPARNNQLFRDWADQYESGADRAAWFRTLFAWIFRSSFFDDQTQVDAALFYLQSYPWPQLPAAFRAQVEAIAGCDLTNLLHNVRHQTLVLAGSDDIMLPLSCSRYLAARIPSASLTVIEEAAHSVQVDQPERFVQEILAFLCKGDEEPS